MLCNEDLLLFTVSGQIPYLAKNSFLEIWAKMLSNNKIAGVSNEPCLQNKLMKWPDFLQVDTSSCKSTVDQNIFGWT